MKDTLVYISYYFPPYNTIASERSIKFINVLKKKYNKIIILTLDDSYIEKNKLGKNYIDFFGGCNKIELINVKLTKLGYEDSASSNFFQKLISGFITRVIWSNGFFWQSNLKKHLIKILSTEKVNKIFVTGPPFITFYSVYKVASKRSIPYILDYRDLWSMNPRSSSFRFTKNILRKTIEKATIYNASNIITVSEGCKKALEHEFPIDKNKIHVQMNLPDLIYRETFLNNYTHKTKQSKNIKFILIGSVYDSCTFWPILKAIQKFPPDILNKIEFHYYGATGKIIQKEFESYNFSRLLINHGFVTKIDSFKALEDADLLISLVDDGKRKFDDRIAGIMTTKVFDYFFSNKTILNIGPNAGDLNLFSKSIHYKSFYNFESYQQDLIYNFIKLFIENPKNFQNQNYNIFQIPLFEDNFEKIQHIFN